MTAPQTGPGEDDPLVKGVQLRQERHRRWMREGDPSVARRLAQIGVLGWIIVVPMLTGIFVGRWLDRTFNSGLFWTAPLLMLGLALGCRCELCRGIYATTPYVGYSGVVTFNCYACR